MQFSYISQYYNINDFMKSVTPRNRPIQQKHTCRNHSPQVVAKSKNKENVPPSQKIVKNLGDNEQSLKICLQLANHHKKYAEQLKRKNEELQSRLKDQMKDMKSLKKELEEIKSVLLQNQSIKKENETLKQSNAELKAKIQEITRENAQLKMKSNHIESIITVGQSSSRVQINPLTLAKQSRRQKYAQQYQSISFVPSVVCIQCQQKDSQIIGQRQRYCNQLRQLQEQVNEFQRIQIMVGVMELQLSNKNICIDFLRQQLDSFQQYSHKTLQFIDLLDNRLTDIAIENQKLKDNIMRHSSSKTVA